ncbi:MAG TPA: YoaK family protein [Acidimicrobiales bacterium]|jgi:uncharacterized membrane protein YoaK (UPF0700 family)
MQAVAAAPMSSILTDAWRTIAPTKKDSDGPLPPLLLALTVVTGLVDAFSYLSLGHVFVANMTGNVVFLAFALAGAGGFSVLASLAAIGAFSAGALLGGRLASSVGHDRGRLVVIVGVLEALFVAVAVVVVTAVHAPGAGAARYALIVILSVAMGAQNAMARALAVPDLTTTVLTLTITGISADSRWAGGAGSKAGRRLVSALSMFVGALIGAFLVLKVSRIGAVLVALCVLGVIVLVATVVSRPETPWVGGVTEKRGCS